MNKWRYGISLLIVIILETTVFSHWTVFGISPSLIIAYLVALSILHGPTVGGYTGLLLGLLEDIMFSQVLGVRALVYFVSATVVGRLLWHNENHMATGMLVTALMSVFVLLGHWFFMAILRIPLPGTYLLGLPMAMFALVNAVLFPFTLLLMRRFLSNERRRFQGFTMR